MVDILTAAELRQQMKNNMKELIEKEIQSIYNGHIRPAAKQDRHTCKIKSLLNFKKEVINGLERLGYTCEIKKSYTVDNTITARYINILTINW